MTTVIAVDQLTNIAVYVVLVWLFVKINWMPAKMLMIAVAVVMFVANPVKKEVDDRDAIEARSSRKVDTLPDRVSHYKPTYQERQNQNRTQLEAKSEEMRNESTK